MAEKKVIRYSWIGAYQAGIKLHPLDHVRELGMKVLNYEAIGIADCSMIEVENVPDILPPYIHFCEYKFIKNIN